MPSYTIITFYKFVNLRNIESLKISFFDFCKEKCIKGTIILASEGINGTLSGKQSSIEDFLQYMPIKDIEYKFSYSNSVPFDKMKVTIKKEIVTLGIPNIFPSQRTGEQISPENWNDLISDPNIVLIDTRNDFEVELGTFKSALNPNTKKFSDFPSYIKKEFNPKERKKMALFCTGGIRCEKASSFLLEQGFENVYQLQGGILNYLEKIDSKDSLWDGDCFIFDKRIIYRKYLK